MPLRLGGILNEARPDDLAALAAVGCTDVRLAVRWSELQPASGRWSGEAVEALSISVMAARAAGLGPWLALLGRRPPPWFDDEGGFADAKTAGRWWPRYVEGVAERMGDVVAGWFPMVSPVGFADQAFAGRDPEVAVLGQRTLMVAWRDAWQILHGGPPVATALALPDDEWTRALRTGEPFPNGVELDGLAAACDLLGGIVAVDADTRADDAAEWLVQLAEAGPERPLAMLAGISGTDDDQRAEAASTAVEMVGVVRGAGVEVAAVFADGLLSDGAPSPASEIIARLVG